MRYHEESQHIRTEKHFECRFCIKKFKTSKSLTSHERIHESKKKLECGKCDKKFCAISSLNFHQKQKHSDEKLKEHECKTCSTDMALYLYGLIHGLSNVMT